MASLNVRCLAIRVSLAALGAAAVASGGKASAHGELPRLTPLDRLVPNLEARIAADPDDADAHYVLGRLHALAFETKSESAAVYKDGHVPRTRYWAEFRWEPDEVPRQEPDPARQRHHLVEAVVHLNRAIALAPFDASYRLALASILEAGESMAREVEIVPLMPTRRIESSEVDDHYVNLIRQFASGDLVDDKILRTLRSTRSWEWPDRTSPRDFLVSRLDAIRRDPKSICCKDARSLLNKEWAEQIAEQYFCALASALPSDSTAESKPSWGDVAQWISHEAASGFVRIVEKRGVRDDEKVRLAVAKATLTGFDGLPPPRAITPIVFSLDRPRPFSNLLHPTLTTDFDLDGSGLPQRWPWLRPETALLVWDPAHEGRITSGRQLFGSVSWWLFFADGYDALDALDDDRDHRLAGPELEGLSAWFDRDGDGVSDFGEVIPVASLGIVALSCRATTQIGRSPANPRGLTLADDTQLPTYDWVTDPLPSIRSREGD